MTKITKLRVSSRKISPFGGLNFCINKIEQAKIPQLIINALGKRDSRAKYSYADAILGLVYGILAGATRLEDLNILKARMHNSALNIPSPDVLAKLMKNQLSTRNFKIMSDSGKSYKINYNKSLNGLMLPLS